MEKLRIDKLLSNMGYGSRSEIKKFAKQALISLNGKVEKDCSKIIDPSIDQLCFDGDAVLYKKYIYLLMNKPAGVISATFDNLHKTVIDLLPEKYRSYDVFPVGRLDKDTEGFLILTNDGSLAHNLLSPKKHVDKEYYAEVDGELTSNDVHQFQRGILLNDGYKTLPADLTILQADPIRSLCRITIREGKFHQVKRMFLSIGKPVLYLKRIRMGQLMLDPSLALGETRELSEEELLFLFTK